MDRNLISYRRTLRQKRDSLTKTYIFVLILKKKVLLTSSETVQKERQNM